MATLIIAFSCIGLALVLGATLVVCLQKKFIEYMRDMGTWEKKVRKLFGHEWQEYETH